MSVFNSLTPEQQEALLDSAAIEPPEGVTSNFDNPDNFNTGARVVTSICLAISTLAIIIRLYARFVLVKAYKPRELLTILGYIIFVIICYAIYRMINGVGLFVHLYDVRLRDVEDFTIMTYVVSFLYCAHIMTIKSAILLEWLEIFLPTGRRNAFFWGCHFLLWLNILFYGAMIIVVNLHCIPLQAMWDLRVEGRCIKNELVEIISAAINLVSDLFVLALPQQVIWRLQMNKKRKIGISIIFTFGILCAIAAGFRIESAIGVLRYSDVTYVLSPLIMWSLTEMTCLFIVLCVPSVPKVWHETKFLGGLPRTIKSWTTLRPSSKGTSTNEHAHPKRHWPFTDDANYNAARPHSGESTTIALDSLYDSDRAEENARELEASHPGITKQPGTTTTVEQWNPIAR